MAGGPVAAAKALTSILHIEAAPRPAREWLVEIVMVQEWATNRADADELAAKWETRFIQRLRRDHNELGEVGRVCRYAFNSSSDYMLQGAAFIEHGRDSDELKESKRRRARIDDYRSHLDAISPGEFEAMCRGLLALLGVAEPRLTPQRGDEGIDFYGRLKLDDLRQRTEGLPDVYRRLNVWMIGQAKHYQATQAATPDIRDLVGAVDLAKGRAFGGLNTRFDDLDILVCDPVFYLFFTTGTISVNGWRLLMRSGVVAMDGSMVAAFLADNGVGMVEGQVSDTSLRNWLNC